MKFLAIALCATVAVAATYDDASATTLRLGHHHAVDSAVDRTAKRFSELVEEKTEGRVSVQVFPGAQLGQELEAFDLLNQGGIDLTVTSVSQMDQVYPPTAVTTLPFIFRDWDHATEAFRGNFGSELAEGLAGVSQVEILAYFGLGFRDLLFVGEPATSVEAMDGLRMRSPENFMWITMFELLGARPTPITWGEVYTAMQTGVADGLDSPPAAALDMKFNEVTSSIVRTNHMFSGMALAMNQGVLERLPAEDQEVIREAAREATEWADREIGLPAEVAAYDRLEESDVTVSDPDDPEEWRVAVRDLWDIVAERHPDSSRLIELLVSQ